MAARIKAGMTDVFVCESGSSPYHAAAQALGQTHAAAAKPRERAFVPGGGGPQPRRDTAQFRYYVGGKSDFRYITVRCNCGLAVLGVAATGVTETNRSSSHTHTHTHRRTDVVFFGCRCILTILRRMYTAQKRFKKSLRRKRVLFWLRKNH